MHLLLAVALLTTTGVAAARADDAITPAALGPRVVRLTYEARATPPDGTRVLELWLPLPREEDQAVLALRLDGTAPATLVHLAPPGDPAPHLPAPEPKRTATPPRPAPAPSGCGPRCRGGRMGPCGRCGRGARPGRPSPPSRPGGPGPPLPAARSPRGRPPPPSPGPGRGGGCGRRSPGAAPRPR